MSYRAFWQRRCLSLIHIYFAGDKVVKVVDYKKPEETGLPAANAVSYTHLLADGIALNAAYEKGFALLGQSTSFRARTARLQKLSLIHI